MSDKKNLVLITGQIRKPKEFKDSEILSIFDNSDIYVCTNKDQSDNLKITNLSDNIFFIEDNEYQKNLQNALLKIGVDDSRWDKIPGLRLLQWQKLNYLISEIGKEKLLTYENVYKLRTDLNISHKDQNNAIKNIGTNEVKMNSDYCFASKSKNFIEIANFFYFAFSDYWNNQNYQAINLKNLREIDFEIGKFQWLKFPEIIVKKDFKLYLKHRLELLFSKKKLKLIDNNEIEKFINKFQHEISDVKDPYENVVYFRKHQYKIMFPSEPSFLHYLIKNNYQLSKLFDNVNILK